MNRIHRTYRVAVLTLLFLAGFMLAMILAPRVRAQEVTNPPPILDGPAGKIFEFLGQGSNWIIAPYGIYDTGTKSAGGGIGIAYKLSDFVVPTLRFDYLDGDVWMPSGSLQLQAPFTLGKVLVTPFVFGGIATPISGRGTDNGTATSILGVGAAARFTEHFGVLADYERWGGFDGNQIRAGFYWKF